MTFELLNINNIFFTFLGYPMSYIEFFGTILNIWSVYLVSKNKILNWPVGVVASVLFMFLFWQIRLYSDALEQVYYIFTGVWGWIAWGLYKKSESTNKLSITYSSKFDIKVYSLVILFGTFILGYFMSVADRLLPNIFTEVASYPYLDSFTTVLSFVATYMLIKRKIEAWYLWLIVDCIGIVLYYIKDVKFVSLLYIVFLILASNGLYSWWKIYYSELKKLKYD